MWLLDVHNLGIKMVSNSVESNLLRNTRPKPAYERQDLEWDRRVRIQLRRVHFGVDTFGRIFIFGKQYPWSGFPWLIKCHLHETIWNIWFVWFKPRTLYNENWFMLSHNLFLILWVFRTEKEQKITERLSMDGFILQGLNWIEVCKSESSVWYISDLEQYFCR